MTICHCKTSSTNGQLSIMLVSKYIKYIIESSIYLKGYFSSNIPLRGCVMFFFSLILSATVSLYLNLRSFMEFSFCFKLIGGGGGLLTN